MKKSRSRWLAAGAFAAAALSMASPGMANPAVSCGGYQPGLLAWISGAAVRPATCAYQGDYIVQQGPTYDGPAIMAPQPTYSPSRTVAQYVHGPYQAPAAVRTEPAPERAVRRTTVKRTAAKKKMVVSVKNELPPGKGKVQIINARAEVRIYGPERMEIRLYRR